MIRASLPRRTRSRQANAACRTRSGEETMAIVVIFSFPGGTVEQYEAVCREVAGKPMMSSLADWPGGGCLAHTAGAAPDGLTVVDVWESPEKFQAFGEKLMPLIQKAGL